jgi:hypothetical protein
VQADYVNIIRVVTAGSANQLTIDLNALYTQGLQTSDNDPLVVSGFFVITDAFNEVVTNPDEPNVYAFTVNFAARGTYVPPPEPPKPEVAPEVPVEVKADSPVRRNQPITIVNYAGDSSLEASRPEP